MYYSVLFSLIIVNAMLKKHDFEKMIATLKTFYPLPPISLSKVLFTQKFLRAKTVFHA